MVVPKVREPFEYTKNLPGKSLRTKLIDCFNDWILAEKEDKLVISAVIEMLHDASLMIDDIEDSSEFRRNKRCAYLKFGLPLTLNSANLAYFEALKLLQSIRSDSSELSSIFADEMINLHVGQGTELYFRENGLCPKMEDYFTYCKQKTGGLFKLFTKLLLTLSKRKNFDSETEVLIIKLSEELGKFYQIRDDYLNIFEGSADDLTEGKYTLPTIFADLEDIRCRNETQIGEVLEILIDAEADKFCIKTLNELAEEMCKIIKEIEEKSGRRNDLQEIIYSLLIKK